jgi:hypothetical protein
MNKLTIKYRGALLALAGLLLQSVNGEDEEKYLSVDLSPVKVFVFEKLKGAKPIPVVDKYKVEQNGRLLQVVEVETNEKIYEITAPLAADIDTKLDKGYEGFKGASATSIGDLILNYYGTRKVHYSRISKKFTLLPSYLKRDGKDYRANGWRNLTGELLISPCGEDSLNQYVAYELSSGKVYAIKVPDGFTEPNFLVNSLDKSQGIVELQAYDIDGEIGHDPDIIIKGSLGWYKIRQKP